MNERRRTLLFSDGYKIPTENGVYIESVDHKFYLRDDWDTANTANSIAVVTAAHKFRIALQGTSSQMCMSRHHYDYWEMYLSGTTNSGTNNSYYAKIDYSGATNTKLIVEKCQSATTYAAGWCNAYTFPDGVTKGYLPALGEMNLAYQNKDAIDGALAKCGGSDMTDVSILLWSSTFYGMEDNGYERSCWDFRWTDGSIFHHGLDNISPARPFAPLEDSN